MSQISLPLLSGFTFIRNALKYDFPITEAIDSMVPILDELVINVGESEDGTEEFIKEHLEKVKKKFPKLIIRSFKTQWDDTLTNAGLVLSQQTNLALDICTGRWRVYLQADEAFHENDLSTLRHEIELEDAVQKNDENGVEGFDFPYYHFYGNYGQIKRTREWYPREIRVVKNLKSIRSFGDAQTFKIMETKPDGSLQYQNLKVRNLNLPVYHYGHARDVDTMRKKILYFHRFWHGDDHRIQLDQNEVFQADDFTTVPFWGRHPAVYFKRILKSKNETQEVPLNASEILGFGPPSFMAGMKAIGLQLALTENAPSFLEMKQKWAGKVGVDFWAARRSTAGLLLECAHSLLPGRSAQMCSLIAFDPDGYLKPEGPEWKFQRPDTNPENGWLKKLRTFALKKLYDGVFWSSHEYPAAPYLGFQIPLDTETMSSMLQAVALKARKSGSPANTANQT